MFAVPNRPPHLLSGIDFPGPRASFSNDRQSGQYRCGKKQDGPFCSNCRIEGNLPGQKPAGAIPPADGYPGESGSAAEETAGFFSDFAWHPIARPSTNPAFPALDFG